MLKRISLLLLLIFSFSICSVFAENWYYVGQSESDQSSYYVDNSSVQKNYQEAIIWVKFTYPNGSIAIYRTYFNRQYKTTKYLYAVLYDSHGSLVYSDSYVTKSQPIIPGSVAESIYNVIW